MRVSDIEEIVPSAMRKREDTGQLAFKMYEKWIKVSESKMRLRKMELMKNADIGFNDVEYFLRGLDNRTWMGEGQGYQEKAILRASMCKKISDEKGMLRKAKVEKESLREEFRESYGRT